MTKKPDETIPFHFHCILFDSIMKHLETCDFCENFFKAFGQQLQT